MSAWRSVTLSDVSDEVDYGYTTSAVEDSSLPRFLRITDIVGSHIDWASVPGCAIDDKKLRKFMLRSGDLVVARTGATVGHAKRIRKHPEAVFASYLVRFRPSQEVDPAYIGAVVESKAYKDFILQNAGGAAQPNANAKVLGSFSFLLPERPVQQRVGQIADFLEDLIENNRRRVEVLEEMAQAIYREWFVDFRHPGHEKDTLVDSPLGAIPKGWRVARVGELCDRIQAGGTPRRSEPAFWDEPDVDWYKTGDLTDSVLIRSSERISRLAFASSSARSFEPGTILMAIYGSPTVGRLGLLESVSSANQAALGLVADPRSSSTEHLWFVLRELREHLNQIAQGAAQQNVSKQKVEHASTVLPPFELVCRFTAAAGPPWRLSHVLLREAAALATLRDLLLPKLVTGQIDVSSLDLEALMETGAA